MRSIHSRLALGLGVSLVVVFLLAGLGSSLALRHGIRDYMITRLDHDAENLLAAIRLQRRRGGGPALQATDPVFERAYSGHYFTITINGTELRSRSLWEHELAVPDIAVGETRTLEMAGPGDSRLLMRAHGFQRGDTPMVIAVAEDLGPVRTTILRWQGGFAIATLLAIILVLVLQRRLLRRALAPLERTREEVRELELGTRHRLTPDAPAEILPLIQALNRLLEALEERLKRSRKAAGDMAHGLKTPLSMLRSLLARPAMEPPLRAEMAHQLELIQGRLERELRRARLMGGTAPGALFQPASDVADVVATLEQIHRDAGLSLETRVTGPGAFPADREDMLELLGNLLDNAFKWAARRILLTVHSTSRTLAISVEDDGPGVPEQHLEALARRGRRLDESREGHGLGLAIVRDVVDFYGGNMDVGPSPALGGLRVRVRLSLPREGIS